MSLHRNELLREDSDSNMGEKFFCGFLLERCELWQRDRAMIQSCITSMGVAMGAVTEAINVTALRRMGPFL